VGLAVGLEACNGCASENNIVARSPLGDSGLATTLGTTSTTSPPAPLDHDWGSWLSMAVTPDGEPAVAYYDKTKTALGYAVGTVGADGSVTWVHEEVDGYANEDGLDTGDRGTYASMAIAGDGTVWIAYRDSGNANLRYATRAASGAWTTNTADGGGGMTPDAGYFASLALDDTGSPVVVHYDKGEGELRVARYSASTGMFSAVVVDEGEAAAGDTGAEEAAADTGLFPRLRIASGVEYIAYYDAAAGDLKMAWGTADNYTLDTIDTEGDVGQWPDVLIDGSTLHVAYHDVGNQHLKYAWGSPGSWTVETVDEGDLVGADSALYLADGDPAVLYYDGRDNDMKRAVRAGTWQVDVVAEDGALGFHNEVATSGADTWAACYDYTQKTLWFSTLD